MKVYYLSDLHLEFYKKTFDFGKIFNFKDCDILCLCGDIGYPENSNYERFLDFCSKSAKYVCLISGNHEYYSRSNSKTIQSTDKMIEDICKKFHNVYFLNNSSLYFKEFDTYVIGSCLWSEVPIDINPNLIRTNDFDMIYYEWEKQTYIFNYDYRNLLNAEAFEFLESELSKINKESKVILLTHHLPSYKLIHDKYKNNPENCLYATEFDNLFEKYNINISISGHSHTPNKIKINNTELLLNPIGYPGELAKPKFNDFIII